MSLLSKLVVKTYLPKLTTGLQVDLFVDNTKQEDLFQICELKLGLTTNDNLDVFIHNRVVCQWHFMTMQVLQLVLNKRVAMKTDIKHALYVTYKNVHIMSCTFPIRKYSYVLSWECILLFSIYLCGNMNLFIFPDTFHFLKARITCVQYLFKWINNKSLHYYPVKCETVTKLRQTSDIWLDYNFTGQSPLTGPVMIMLNTISC